MSLILSFILTIVFILIYMLMIQVFTVLFRITGLTKEKARFQVISLLTNSGYTSKETELITTNRSRRKVAKFAMITGTIFNVVIVSLLINILFNINISDEMESLKMMGLFLAIFIGLMIFIRLPFFRKGVEKLIEKIATKIREKKSHENVITELDVYGNKSIVEVNISKVPEVLKDTSIEDANLMSRYNIIVLLIQRKNRVIDVSKDTIIQKGDKLVLFGKSTNINDLFDIHIKHQEELIDESNINNITLINNYGANAMTEIEIKHVPEILLNKTLGESILKEKYDIIILMVKHEDKAVIVDADTIINEGDEVVLFGPYQYIKKLFIDEIE